MIQFFILILIFPVLGFCANAKHLATSDFKFETDQLFHLEKVLVENQVYSYSLQKNEKVKLLIVDLDKKAFWKELSSYSEEQIKNEFLNRDKNFDIFSNQKGRDLLHFNKKNLKDATEIYFKYRVEKNEERYIEITKYIFTKNQTALASIQFPESLDQSQQQQIEGGVLHFQITTSVNNNDKTTKSDKFSKLKLLNLFFDQYFVVDSYAGSAKDYSSCYSKNYIYKGDFSMSSGSAIFNFEKIINDLNQEALLASKAGGNTQKLECLANFFNDSVSSAKSYWATRGKKEGCIQDAKYLDSPTDTCSESTLKEMKNSFAYIDKFRNRLNDLAQGNVTSQKCSQKSFFTKQEQELKKLNANVQQSFCCSDGDGKESEQGPLYKMLSSEEGFSHLSASQKTSMCVEKTKNDLQKTMSFKDCLQAELDSAGHMIKDAIKGIGSLFDLGLLKAIGQFAVNLPESAQKLFEAISDHLAQTAYNVTNCMSDYEKDKFLCKSVPKVLAIMFSPAMIKNVLTAVASKASKSEIAALISKAASENKELQKMKEISKQASEAVSKVAKPILDSDLIKPSFGVLKKIKDILGTDVSTPFKDLVLKKASMMTEKISESGAKILRKPSAIEIEKSSTQVATVKAADELYPNNSVPRSHQSDLKSYSQKEFQALSEIEEYQALKNRGASEFEIKQKQARLLNRANDFSEEERVNLASAITRDGRKFTEEEGKFIIEAHEVGLKDGKKFGEFSVSELREKTRLLNKAGITDPAEVRLVMESGITGTGEGVSVLKYQAKSAFSNALRKPISIEQTEVILRSQVKFDERALRAVGFNEVDIGIIERKIKSQSQPIQPAPAPTSAQVITEVKVAPSTTVQAPIVELTPVEKLNRVKPNVYGTEIERLMHNNSNDALWKFDPSKKLSEQQARDELKKHFRISNSGKANELAADQAIKSVQDLNTQVQKFKSDFEQVKNLPANQRGPKYKDQIEAAEARLIVAQKKCSSLAQLYQISFSTAYDQFMKKYHGRCQ